MGSIQKKIGGQILVLLPLYSKFLVSIETDGSKNIVGCFLKPS
jgi:hypothetical protein